jgi:hypothetical protein
VAALDVQTKQMVAINVGFNEPQLANDAVGEQIMHEAIS